MDKLHDLKIQDLNKNISKSSINSYYGINYNEYTDKDLDLSLILEKIINNILDSKLEEDNKALISPVSIRFENCIFRPKQFFTNFHPDTLKITSVQFINCTFDELIIKDVSTSYPYASFIFQDCDIRQSISISEFCTDYLIIDGIQEKANEIEVTISSSRILGGLYVNNSEIQKNLYIDSTYIEIFDINKSQVSLSIMENKINRTTISMSRILLLEISDIDGFIENMNCYRETLNVSTRYGVVSVVTVRLYNGDCVSYLPGLDKVISFTNSNNLNRKIYTLEEYKEYAKKLCQPVYEYITGLIQLFEFNKKEFEKIKSKKESK